MITKELIEMLEEEYPNLIFTIDDEAIKNKLYTEEEVKTVIDSARGHQHEFSGETCDMILKELFG